MPKKLLVASRPSPLALRQAEEALAGFPHLKYRLLTVPSYGDKHREISLLENPPEDIFTRELDTLLLQKKADIAVHSAKDLPYPLPDGLAVIALLPARDQRDALVSRGHLPLSRLPRRARVGTSSPLRCSNLLALRPDLRIVSLRGNIAERLRQVADGEVDAAVVAVCALERLGLTAKIAEILPFAAHPLQGHLAVTARSDRGDLRRIFRAVDVRPKFGTVTLAGAGPGDPLLLTRRAELALQAAEVIFYDDLSKNIIASGEYSAEQIYVGKRKGRQAQTQAAINELLYQTARSGKNVVRLKGGDPFIFGRGGEEVEYLQRRMIQVSVIPGVSAGLAAGALSLIPLTRRGAASSVAFCTGHPADSIQTPAADTLVYYMAGASLPEVVRKILQSGRAPQTPAACVLNVSLPEQKIIKTTLAQLKKKRFTAPLILIAGEVVRQTNPPELPGVLFTGARAAPPGFVQQPLIELRPLASYKKADRELNQKYDWLVFTSRHAVKYYFARLAAQERDARSLTGVKIASIGRATSAALSRHGVRADLQPENETAAGLLQALRGVRGQKILLPCSNLALPVLYNGLRKNNQVARVVVYRNVCPRLHSRIELRDIDKVIFTSPSTVYNFRKIYRKIPPHLEYATRGTTTAEALRHAKIQTV
ncbi:MAG: uroporphyrinogen-III C-methyltransferase [Candidatus Margulisbacteria bacterium]|jgi:uroporphyrinogen III methyltransferase/synthase|nr:uroporphyrinogen-III C-methyltransferase [Candidatus Margulisiibacteriota bacterium]